MNDKQYTQEMIKNLNTRLKTKQEALTFDDTPTEGSVNPVTSEGIKAYVDASKGTIYTAGENITISPNNVISATDTTYTAGDNITIVNNVINSTTDVSGTNDGTNWTSLTVNGDTKTIPQGIEIYSNTWFAKSWTGLTNFSGNAVWNDGENIYYSSSSSQYVLDKATSTWSTKTWTGLTNFSSGNIWTDGENIYYSSDSKQYVLNKATSTWTRKTWTGLTSFYGYMIWTDGENVYCTEGSISLSYVLDKATSVWSRKTWYGLTSFTGSNVWTDGENVYYSDGSTQYVLDKSTSTWSQKTWGGLTYFAGTQLWTDGKNIYYSFYNGHNDNQYILDKSTSIWSPITWNGVVNLGGAYVWTDGDNIYYSASSVQCQLDSNKAATVLAKVAETGDYSDLKNKPIINPTLEGNEEKLTGLEVENAKYKVPEVKILDGFSDEWIAKTWTGLTSFEGSSVWTDGENIYYSRYEDDYVLDKATSTWSPKTWVYPSATLTSGSQVWTDGENIYYSDDSYQYVLDKLTSTWSNKTWTGLTKFYGINIWTDGENIYYSRGTTQKVLDKATSTWSNKTWTGLTNFYGYAIWTDGENIYYSYSTDHYVLNKSTSTWTPKTWTGLTNFSGRDVWTDGENIYYSDSSYSCILDKATSTWLPKGSSGLSGRYVWTDGEDIYYSYNEYQQFQLNYNYKDADVLAKFSETGDYNDLKNKPLIPEEKTIYTYSISINKGADTITLINIQTSEALLNNLTFGDLINNIYLNTLAAEGDYTTMQGSFGFIDSKSDTQFTVSFANGNSYTFASADSLTITTHLEQSRTFYSRN